MKVRSNRFRKVAGLGLFGIACILAEQRNETQAQEHFARAHQAQNAGDLQTAIAEYLITARLLPDTGEVYASLGLAYHAAAQFADSAQALRKAISLKPQLRGVYLFLGIDYVRLSQPERALPCLQKALEQEPGNKEAVSWLGTALWESGRIAAALQQLRKANDAFPSDCDLLFLLGEAYGKAANQEIEKVLNQSVGTALYHEAFGNIYLDQRDWEKAEGHFRRSLQQDPQASGAHFGLGQLYLQQRKLAQAAAEFQKEQTADPASAAAISSKLAIIALLEGHAEDAIHYLSAGIKLSKEGVADALGLPGPTITSELIDEDGARYRAALEALRALPDCPARHLALAFVNTQLNLPSESLAEWQIFAAAVPDSTPTNQWQRAQADFARHDFIAASRQLEAITAADPHNLRALYLLSKTYQRLSVIIVAQMLSIDPDFYRAHELLAKNYQRLEQNDKALAEFRTVERMRPTLSGLHFEIGHLLWSMQDPEAAIKELREELRLNPDHPEANAEVGTILVAKHDPAQGTPYLQKALHLKPTLTQAHVQLGMAFYRLHKFPEAAVELKEALADDAEGNAHFILGMVYRRMGRQAESKVALDESRRIRSERLMQVKIEKDDPDQ